MKKESRFCKKGVKILLAIGLLGTMILPTNTMANEYVTPGNAEKYDSQKVHGYFIFNGFNEDGTIKDIQVIEKDVELDSTYKEAGIEFPTASYKDLTFLGWVDKNGNTVDENTKINSSYNVLYPEFDKVVQCISFKYPDTNNDIKSSSETYILEHGATLQDVVNAYANYLPEDMSKGAEFSGWINPNSDENMDKKAISGGEWVQAEFKNKYFLLIEYFYYNTKGMQELVSKAGFVSKNASEEVMVKEIPLPESFEGLRMEWEDRIDVLESTNGEAIIKDYIRVQVYPKYENYLVGFAIDDSFREESQNTRGVWTGYDYSKMEAYYPMVAEKGETIKVPEMKGYDNIVWVGYKPEGDNLVIKGHTNFHGYVDKTDAPVVNPDDGNHDETEVPEVTLPEENINNAVNEVKNAAKGDKVMVDMKDNVILPVEVLESARGKDIEVVFNMGAYSWSINGLDITEDTLKAINLEVKLNANAISADVVKTLAKDRPTMQLSLSHNGEFGFKAKLQFNIGAEHKGKYGNLYYYNKEGKLEFINAGKIDEDGNVSLEFTHASDYVVVIDEKSMANETKNTESPIKDTSSDTNGSVAVVMIFIALLGGAYCFYNKKARVGLK